MCDTSTEMRNTSTEMCDTSIELIQTYSNEFKKKRYIASTEMRYTSTEMGDTSTNQQKYSTFFLKIADNNIGKLCRSIAQISRSIAHFFLKFATTFLQQFCRTNTHFEKNIASKYLQNNFSVEVLPHRSDGTFFRKNVHYFYRNLQKYRAVEVIGIDQ